MLHDRNIIITHPSGPVYQVGNDSPHFNIVQGAPFQRLTIISDQRLATDNSEFSFPGICDKDMITLLWPAADIDDGITGGSLQGATVGVILTKAGNG